MRKINALRLAIVSGIAVLMLGFMIVPNVVEANGATVITQFGCSLGYPGATWTDTQTVITPSGNTRLTCHFTIASASVPTQAIVQSGFLCSTFLGSTDNSFRVIDTEGTAMLRCMIKANEN